MTLYAIGLNHRRAPVAIREAFALTEADQQRLYETLPLSPDAEMVLLTTCNRTEAFLHGSPTDAAVLTRALADAAGEPWPEPHAFRLDDEAAVEHVLSVTAGLRSLVLGDAQILYQVKEAYRRAVDADAVGPVLHRLMHAAFRAAKRVRSETGLAQGAASVSSLAVAAARAHVPGRSLDGRHVLLLGAGQMGLAALSALASFDLASLTVANRSAQRAEEAAATYGGVAIPWADRHGAFGCADVVLVASGAREPIVRADALPLRHADRPVLVIDIAVPRNVERAVDALPGYTVLDLDLLNQGVEATAAARRRAVPAAQAIVKEGLAEFVTWFFHQQALQPTIQALRDTFDAIRTQEIERHAHRIPEVARADVERLTESIMQKLLAVPVVRLKATDPDSLDFVRGVRMLQQIFSRPDCDDASLAEAAASPAEAPADVELPAVQEPSPGGSASAPAGGCPFGHGAPRASASLSSSETSSAHAYRNARQ